MVPRSRRYYEALRLPSLPFAALRCLRFAIPPSRRSFAPCGRRRPAVGSGELVFRFPSRKMSVETDGAPKFLGTPRVPWPCSPTPAGSVTPGHRGVPTRSPRLTRARTPAMIFRGSIARPGHSLSTLRREGRPSTTQDSLPAAGQLCRAGFVNPQGSDERFPSSRLFPLSQASWRNVSSSFSGDDQQSVKFRPGQVRSDLVSRFLRPARPPPSRRISGPRAPRSIPLEPPGPGTLRPSDGRAW